MSSFFTLPASQRKRKRPEPGDQSAKSKTAPKRREARDESISGSDVSDDDAPAQRQEQYEGSDDDDDEHFEDEDPAAKRVRLAEQYLANTQKEVLEEAGFDAADVDAENLRRRMGERLKEDTAESRGKLYRQIAHDLDWSHAQQQTVRLEGQSGTGIAVHGQHVYSVSKDMILSKWELPSGQPPLQDGKQVGRVRKTLKRVAYVRGSRKQKQDRDYQGHTSTIFCIAVSPDGKFVATGGADNRLIVWDASSLKPLKLFTHHRDSVISLAFRRGTNQLFSASKDRTVKVWSLDELAYVETLFGHQDEVVDVSALAQEKCVTVGARDRTARLWKVVEESQLVFRGGGAAGKPKHSRTTDMKDDSGVDLPELTKPYNEGSMDRVACIDDDTFITGSDNGALSLWNIHKKKPVFTYPLAHGLEPPLPIEQLSAEEHPDSSAQGEPRPRWITALRAIPFSDVFITGSWDGVVRVWCISPDRRRIEALGAIGSETSAHGVVNDIAIVDRGDRGKDGVLVAAAVGKEHRLGRWEKLVEGKNSIVVFTVPHRSSETADAVIAEDGDDNAEAEDDFAGFD